MSHYQRKNKSQRQNKSQRKNKSNGTNGHEEFLLQATGATNRRYEWLMSHFKNETWDKFADWQINAICNGNNDDKIQSIEKELEQFFCSKWSQFWLSINDTNSQYYDLIFGIDDYSDMNDFFGKNMHVFNIIKHASCAPDSVVRDLDKAFSYNFNARIAVAVLPTPVSFIYIYIY